MEKNRVIETKLMYFLTNVSIIQTLMSYQWNDREEKPGPVSRLPQLEINSGEDCAIGLLFKNYLVIQNY